MDGRPHQPPVSSLALALSDRPLRLMLIVLMITGSLLILRSFDVRHAVPSLPELKALRLIHDVPRAVVQSMRVEAAYASVKRPYKPFDASIAKMPAAEADYLRHLFKITDYAVIERVQWLQTLWRHKDYSGLADNYGEILRELDTLAFPTTLETVHYLILNAIYEQQQYFLQWKGNPRQKFDPNATLVQGSHLKLVKAYDLLMTRYAEEDEYNRRAFYDHLCLLSFI